MKTFADLIEFIKSGGQPIVTFANQIEDQECYAESGMRAKAIRAAETDSDGTVEIVFSFVGFDEHNRPFESASYYDENDKATKTAREAGNFKEEDVYFFSKSDELAYFLAVEPESVSALFAEFQADSPDMTYVQWLEAEVLASREPIVIKLPIQPSVR